MSSTFRLLTRFAGVLLLGAALALPVYALVADEPVSDLGWVVVVALVLLGVTLLWRAARWTSRGVAHIAAKEYPVILLPAHAVASTSTRPAGQKSAN